MRNGIRISREKQTASEDAGMESEAAERCVTAGRAASDEQSLAVSEALWAEPEGAGAAVREIVDAPSAWHEQLSYYGTSIE